MTRVVKIQKGVNTMLLINEERGVEGIIFTPDETQKPAGIVV